MISYRILYESIAYLYRKTEETMSEEVKSITEEEKKKIILERIRDAMGPQI